MMRPVLEGEVLAVDGSWMKARFLIDTGADRTVFSEDVWRALALEPVDSPFGLAGVGGAAESLIVETEIRFVHDGTGKVVFKGLFSAVRNADTLDMTILGRDILDSFALIVDRPGDTIALLGQRHYYTIAVR
jgi:hypothetical protein